MYSFKYISASIIFVGGTALFTSAVLFARELQEIRVNPAPKYNLMRGEAKKLRRIVMKKIVRSLVISLLLSGVRLYASPSTQIWNPSTDIQATKTFHLNIDNYVNDTMDQYFFGVEYGLFKNFELGFDINENQYSNLPQANQYPLYFNGKYALPEGTNTPAVAAGAEYLGTKSYVSNYDICFALVAKTFGKVGRLTVGGYEGNGSLLLDEKGNSANTGAILTWDKNITDKIWACVDYASGKSWYGTLSLGGSYAFSSNTSVIFAYVIPNNYNVSPFGNTVPMQNMFTTQLDINF